MEYSEFIKNVNKHKRSISVLEDSYVKAKTHLRKGDFVKFVEKGSYYTGAEDIEHSGEIYAFEICDKNKIIVKCKGIHYKPLTIECTKHIP